MLNKEEVLDRLSDIILYAKTAKEDYNNDDKKKATTRLIATKVSIETLLDDLKNK
ncbi:hypothetical protein NV379_02265 [Paenibacillus sp. N1-5-1-14]|uniref:hypothetical protein n=1 Tax=Paenibacillus radicibacter TaxID=2972488 RepID=UPI0021593B92|nr:hypothetical protein [Paenibacillus radicibacter]MCR8641471.1 hypothetical protein [Paenibacillus radicibacter]